jgi:hypothetical protein
MKTSFCIDLNVEHAYLVKGTKEGTNWAEISAPSAFNNKDKTDKKNENDQGDREEIIRYKLSRVQNQNRECSYQHPDWTDICEDKPNKK